MNSYHESIGQCPWSYLKPKIEKVEIEEGITSVTTFAFYSCSKLTSVTFPRTITILGANLFEGCTSLKSVTIPDSVTWIPQGMFYGCSNLETVDIPDSITSIQMESFFGCGKLKSIRIPPKVKKISDESFCGCSSLTSIVIPENVTEIGTYALKCSNLKSVAFLGKSAPSTHGTVFSGSPLVVCVPDEYSSTTFCGREVSKDSTICGALYNEDLGECEKFDFDVEKNEWGKAQRTDGECAPEDITIEGMHSGSGRIQIVTILAYMLALVLTFVLLP